MRGLLLLGTVAGLVGGVVLERSGHGAGWLERGVHSGGVLLGTLGFELGTTVEPVPPDVLVVLGHIHGQLLAVH